MTIYAITNKAPSLRMFYDIRSREVRLSPGHMCYADIDEGTHVRLAASRDYSVEPATFDRVPNPHIPNRQIPPPPLGGQFDYPVAGSGIVPATSVYAPGIRSPIVVTGHFGIGDNLHQRAVMRELMKRFDVHLRTCHFELYHDLVAEGLKLYMRPTALHAQAKTIARERALFDAARFPPVPQSARAFNIGYPKVLVDQYGSILEAMFGCVGLKMPKFSDFGLPVKAEWTAALREKYLGAWDMKGKRLLVTRPVVVRKEWDGRSRNPDPKVYDEIYRSLRDQFFVVSVADLANGREWIDGPVQDVDVRLHQGELSFPELAALTRAADMVYCNAGFMPVLSQAVGTPLVVVYGGRESFKTTQRVGVHLAPTCPVDVINPCDCHAANHQCDKRVDVPKALDEVAKFVSAPSLLREEGGTLVFGTFYVDSPDRDNLTDLWIKLHTALNPECDFLAVDSQSPIKKFSTWAPYDGRRHRWTYFNFPDNVGHLSRSKVTPGRDGWGRAFCKGLEIACDLGYSYAVHVEGDSLFRLRISDIVEGMRKDGVDVASTTVEGMRVPGSGNGWVETGLMFFSTSYVERSKFIQRYDWQNRRVSPTPELFIRREILEKDLDHRRFRLMPWRALRADKNQITRENVLSLDLDWVTHQHASDQQDVYRQFVDAALGSRKEEDAGSNPAGSKVESARDAPSAVAQQDRAPPSFSLAKLNLGCGTNRLEGWTNHDAEVDITKRLPWIDRMASHLVIEHCVEHVPYRKAVDFFREAYRVLAPGGVLRVTVPSLEQIARCEEADYFKFTTKWQPLGPTRRGAMHAIIYAHGHEMVWNAQLMKDTLYFVGFDDVKEVKPGESDDPVLRGVEGHGKVIGDKFNLIESCTCEARKSGTVPASVGGGEEVAIVLGGGEGWEAELEEARRLVGERPIRYYIVNDQIKSFPESGVACTLHPDKLNGHFNWLGIRRRAGLPEPEEIWSHRKHGAVTHDTASREWKGSSGLFAVQIARKKHKKIIGVGVPMTVEGGHFERRQKWQSAITFRDGWNASRRDLADCFRSTSGWTAEQFGRPDEEWLARP